MSAAETIALAIEKLEGLRDNSAKGTWIVRGNDPYCFISADRYEPAGEMYERDADLIVTLHRTIDAQLKFLRNSLVPEVIYGWDTYSNDACVLAEAILGGDR